MDKIREELKVCPRCGSEARLITAQKDKRRQTNKIECTNKPCLEITRAAMFGISDIIKIWNTRSHDEEIKTLSQDCKNLVEMNNNIAKIVDSKDSEIKKLREALNNLKIKSNQYAKRLVNYGDDDVIWEVSENLFKDGE